MDSPGCNLCLHPIRAGNRLLQTHETQLVTKQVKIIDGCQLKHFIVGSEWISHCGAVVK